MYEYNAFCTSIVVKLQDGTIVHGRNLDYDGDEFLRKTAVTIDVFRGSIHLYSSTGFAWYLGVSTGISVNKFSISLNQRRSGGKIANLIALGLGYEGNLWELRKALTYLANYDEAVEYLSTVNMADAAYYIIAGENEGVDITRDRIGSANLWKLDEKN